MVRLLNSGMRAHGPRRYKPDAPEEVVAPAATEEIPTTAAVPNDLTTITALMGWVGNDTVRAQAVLDIETAKTEKQQRKSLITQLQVVLAQDDNLI